MSLLSGIIGISALMVSDTVPPATQLQQAEVIGDKSEEVAPQTLHSKTIMGNAVISGVEGIIRTLPGVVATDELSSQYSVRGGSFDENLMLINGFEVYKPQLARSGQQEGLSAIHPDMVGQLEFSTGGFSAMHGDKLSSVLAVDYRPSGFADFRHQPLQYRTRFGFYEQRFTVAHRQTLDNGRINVHMLGLRNKSNRLFQRGLDTQGDYESQAQDVQYMFHSIGERWTHEALMMGQNSVYSLYPSSRTTEFGTVTEVLRLSVYMAGKESYAYQNGFAGWRSTWHPNQHNRISFNAQWMQALETESADVESAYLLGEVDENLGSDDFGEITYWRGSGGHMRHARNAMWTQTGEVSVRGEHRSERSTWHWGSGLRQTHAIDIIDEWVNLDSAGYSLPHHRTVVSIDSADTTLTIKDHLLLHQTTKSQGQFTNVKQWSMTQWAYRLTENQSLTVGIRQIYDTRSGELRISPRASWQMTLNDEWEVDLRGGSYAQTASVRELRNWKLNQLETDAHMQHAWHAILGASRTFKRSGRPMYWRGEAYIKYLDHAYPFEQDGMRLRYLGTDPIQARIRGIDQRLHTEWVDGAESWLSLSFFDAKDFVQNDWQRRPTDYGMSMSLRVEDQLPDAPDNRVYMQIQYTGGFPFGAPLSQEMPFQSSAYRRMDLGLERVLHVQGFQRLSLTLEVFNLLEIRNTASYFWIMDISTAREYAVPNYLTQRLINLSLRAEF